MIKAVIFDIDNTLYDYDKNHICGMKALADYCESAFGVSGEEMKRCYKEAQRIGQDTAGYGGYSQPSASNADYAGIMGEAVVSACFKYVPCILGYTDPAGPAITRGSEIYAGTEKSGNMYWNWYGYDCLCSV